MRKITALLLCPVIVLLSVFPVFAGNSLEEEREYLEDGSYFVEVINDGISNEKEEGIFMKLFSFLKKLIDFFRGRKSVSKTKYLNYYSSDNELLWTARLEGDFVYTKNSAECISSRFGMEIADSDWKLISSECDKNENTAEASFSVRQYKLSVPLKTIEKTLTLTCDTKGNVK